MKKIAFLALIGILLGTGLQAQYLPPSDTLPCFERQRTYHYSIWFDTALWFLHPKDGPWSQYGLEEFVPTFNSTCGNRQAVRLYQQYTSKPLKVKGLWAIVSQSEDYPDTTPHSSVYPWPILNNTKLPEYLYLYTINPAEPKPSTVGIYSHYLQRIAGARWDTLQPRAMCIPRFYDGHQAYDGSVPFVHPYVFEVYFDTTYVVDGEFWIGGTTYSNESNPRGPGWKHFPTKYLQWGVDFRTDIQLSYMICDSVDGPWTLPHSTFALCGPFGVITEYQWFAQALTADSAQGMAYGTDYCTDSTVLSFTAVPNEGFRFSHWEDGSTDNPRNVLVTQDTIVTAFFNPLTLHSVEAECNYPNCHVDGDSTYYYGDTAVLLAYADDSAFLFSHWNDGNSDNPRSVIVTQDTFFSAFFIERQGILAPESPAALFSLTPNPAHSTVTLTTNRAYASACRVTLRDAAGTEVLSRTLPAGSQALTLSLAHLPAGSYFVSLHSPEGINTQKLVIQ